MPDAHPLSPHCSLYSNLSNCTEEISDCLVIPWPNPLVEQTFVNIHSRFFKDCPSEELSDPEPFIVFALVITPICLIPVMVSLVVLKTKNGDGSSWESLLCLQYHVFDLRSPSFPNLWTTACLHTHTTAVLSSHQWPRRGLNISPLLNSEEFWHISHRVNLSRRRHWFGVKAKTTYTMTHCDKIYVNIHSCIVLWEKFCFHSRSEHESIPLDPFSVNIMITSQC